MGLVTLAKLKSATYGNLSEATYDTELQALIDDVSQQAVQYMDRETAYTLATCPADVSDALCTQISWRWRKRDTPGQIRHEYEDGSSDNFSTDLWISAVKQVLDLHKRYTMMG